LGKAPKKSGIAVAGRWIPVPLDFLKSRACAELSPHGAKLLMDVFSMLGTNAYGNGDISLTPKIMKVRGWSGRETLNATIRELEANGLLVRTRQGSRLDCILYALTIYPLNCRPEKIEVTPGCYSLDDYMLENRSLRAKPTEASPAVWRRARKQNR
jgi:hypothetical protein